MADTKNSLTKNQQGVLVAAAVALLVSLLPWFTTVTFEGPGQDSGTTAWTSFATFGLVLLLGAAAFVAVEALSPGTLPQVVPWTLIAVVMAVLGTILIALKAMTFGTSTPGAEAGAGWSGLLLIVVAIVLTFFVVQSFRESDDEVTIEEPDPDS